MNTVFENINQLKDATHLNKHEKLVHGITSAIEAKALVKGDKLPSINKMVSEIGFARKTIVKAYEELKGRGIVESKNFKGYYIADVNTGTKLRVALVLYAFHEFQQDFYNTFREQMGSNYVINVFFHHNNIDVLSDILTRISGRYGMYVIAPIPSPKAKILLKKIPAEKLLVVDRYVALPEAYSFIAQEFENSTYQQLVRLLPEIKKYNKFILFYKEESDNPKGIYSAFNQFIKEYKINGEVQSKYVQGSLEKGVLYFFISDGNLWNVLSDSKPKNFSIGKDIGILAHNDNAIKAIIFGGITTISVDFKQMAKEAAQYIKHKEPTRKIIPSELIHRNSL